MKPTIYTDTDDGNRWLVDADSTATHYEATTGKRLVHFETAVRMDDLAPGQYRVSLFPIAPGIIPDRPDTAPESLAPEVAELWESGLATPWPCVFVPITNKHARQSFESPIAAGLHLAAARALLSLARSRLNVESVRLTDSFRFTPSRTERPEHLPPGLDFIGWEPWRFHVAWHFSSWQAREITTRRKMTLAARFEKMRAAGYPHGLKAFEALHRGLFGKPTN
jgi:hypothetical protein